MIIPINITTEPHDICTPKHAAEEIGLNNPNYIYMLTRLRNKDGDRLDTCYPFGDEGPMFIVKNEKFYAMKKRHGRKR